MGRSLQPQRLTNNPPGPAPGSSSNLTMFTIYIVDRANQVKRESYSTQEAADDAVDRWEALGADIFLDRLQAVLNADAYARHARKPV